ncbi:MAG: HAD family hydrolase [Deltaproteobacteria bacterium]|nr:HAD family hydrolase [Deltaproteobacteria bacterium]
MRFDAVLFDLDGTLLDTLRDIAESMNAALESLGAPAVAIEDYRRHIGDGVTLLAGRVLPAGRRDQETVGRCVAAMRDLYSARLVRWSRPYPGIPGLLDALAAAGVAMAVLSNKPHALTISLTAQLLERWHFAAVFGERQGVPRKPDPQAALEVAGLMRVVPGRVLYLGDTGTDMQTAKRAGMFAAGALWGFRDLTELEAAGADALVSEPGQVLDLL